MAHSWKHNIWTGRQTLDVSPNGRIIRQPYHGQRPLYSAEHWGDYSLAYPVRGPWRESLAKARRDLVGLARA